MISERTQAPRTTKDYRTDQGRRTKQQGLHNGQVRSRRGMNPSPASAAATPEEATFSFRLARLALARNAGIGEPRLPMFDKVRSLTVNFEPGQRFAEDSAVDEAPLAARARANVA